MHGIRVNAGSKGAHYNDHIRDKSAVNAHLLDRDDYPLPNPDLAEGSRRSTLYISSDTARFEAILLRLHSVIDVAGFWAAIQSILNELLPNDACVVYLNARDFSKTGYIPKVLATSRASKFLKWMRPSQQALMPTLLNANPGTKVCQLSDVSFDPRQLRYSEFFRRYMVPEGWHHIGCLLFWEEGRLSSEILILRTAKQGSLTAQEIAALSRLHPHIEATLHRLIALEKRDRARFASWSRRTSASNSEIHNVSLSEGEALTPAEAQIVQLLHAGLSNKEIAQRLQKSIRTVKTQLTSIYRKYAVRSRTRLLAATRIPAADACPNCESTPVDTLLPADHATRP